MIAIVGEKSINVMELLRLGFDITKKCQDCSRSLFL